MQKRSFQRWLLVTLVVSPALLCGQTPSLLPAEPAKPRVPPQPTTLTTGEDSSELPNAPSAVHSGRDVVQAARSAFETTGDKPPTIEHSVPPIWEKDPHPSTYARLMQRRMQILNPYQRFLDTDIAIPMSSRDKAFMAATDVSDPGNLATIALGSGIFTASNAHSAYGPGMAGFGRNLGYSLSLSTMGEFFGTFLIPSVAHQDPRYYRMPHAPVQRRILHAVAHSFVTRSDYGTPMPNYATLLTYPIGAELSNLYVPGLQTDGRSTATRIFTAMALDPAEALVGEFLPDISKRIHIRILFVQQIINNINVNTGTAAGAQ